MKNDFLVAITQLSSERGLPKEIVLQAVEQALIAAYKRNFGGAQNITAKIDPNSGKAHIYALKDVVEQVHDRRIQISVDDARRYDPMAQLGGTVQLESTADDFGRIPAQTAKQVILQKIREAERDMLFQSFSEREGEIVHGAVHSVDASGITVNLGKIEGLLPKSEQIPTERYRHNQKIRALVTEVNRTTKGPQVLLSRTHRNMLRRLLELEVPEIFNGLVEIKSIAREAGQRSKVAVASSQDGLDPVGACVGQRGVRIQAIVNELSGERIDVVEWKPDASQFIAKALSPAQTISVNLSEDENGDKVATVIVEDKQLSLAIGKEGQNARLAAKLTGWRVDIKSQSQVLQELARRLAPVPIVEETPPPSTELVGIEAPVELAAAEQAAAAITALAPVTSQAALAQPAETAAATVAQPSEAPSGEAGGLPASAAGGELPTGEMEGTPEIAAAARAAAVEMTPPAEPEPTFEQALAAFEAEQPEDAATMRKRKEGKEKGRILEFDEKLGQVIAKRKHKGGRAREDWMEGDEE